MSKTLKQLKSEARKKKALLDKAGAMQHYAEWLKAGIEVERPIALGVLKIKAKLGELMPAKNGRPKKGDENPAPGAGFSPHTVSAYRKLSANRERLEEYYETTEDVPSQKACVAVDLLPELTRAAKERQKQGPIKLTDPSCGGDARAKAAELVGVSPSYVSDAGRKPSSCLTVYLARLFGNTANQQPTGSGWGRCWRRWRSNTVGTP